MLSRQRIHAIIGSCVMAFVLAIPAQSQDLRVSSGVVCDTQNQLETFIGYAEAEPSTAFAKVQRGGGESKRLRTYCGRLFSGEKVSEVRVKHGHLNIHEISVVGINAGQVWQRLSAPFTQFAAFPIKDVSA